MKNILTEKKYKFADRQKFWQERWQSSNIYKWQPTGGKKFVIDTPPPTVSGTLHIGHLYSYTHTDFIARFKRMQGHDVYYPIGFDDNGLPTERLVEKKRKVRASQMPRQEFIDLCQEVVASEEEQFRQLFKGLGLSVDWGLEYRTINQECIKLSQLSFLDLARKQQVYRSGEPILWDVVDQTALAQAEIEDKERNTFMNDIIFKTEDGDELIIATTRPEMLPAVQAIFYHPDDERYKHLKDKQAISPLFGKRIPILADEMVLQDKGTGLVMCCTFGDQTDVHWWRTHKLDADIIIDHYGKMTNLDQVGQGAEYAKLLTGLKIKEARAKIIDMLKGQGLLIKQEEKLQNVKCAERSGAALEILMIPQWFVKTIDHKQAILDSSDKINWHPKSMKIKLEAWVKAVSWDWCISRQRYFGVPFPVWYSKRSGEEGKAIFASPDQLPVDPQKDLPAGYNRDEIEADKDVMDTWSTSSISPQLNSKGITQGMILDEAKHTELFPADLRPQAHDIIRTWAFYTILKAHLHQQTIPWGNIMVSGWCLAKDKSKMSKSKGNVIAISDLLDDYGSDVARYWAASSKLGADTAYSDDVLKNGKRLVNKMWNAAKFVSQYFDGLNEADKKLETKHLAETICHSYDKYMLRRLDKLIAGATKAFDNYEYAEAMQQTERFFFDEFCDNYLEICKVRAYGESGGISTAEIKSARLTLFYIFDKALRLFAPFMPYITEELFIAINPQAESLHIKAQWPEISNLFTKLDDKPCRDLLDILDLVRRAKAQDNLSVKAPISLLEIKSNNSAPSDIISDLKFVTNSEAVEYVAEFTNNNNTLFNSDEVAINVLYKQE